MKIKHCIGSFSPLDGTVQLNVVVDADNKQKLYETLQKIKRGRPYQLELKPERKKRSLTANAYAWVLMDKIAGALNITKELVYRQIVKRVGPFDVVRVADEAVPRFVQVWQAKGLGWITEVIDSYNNQASIAAYYGSSSYSTREMNRFIDEIVDECKALNIETMNGEDLTSLLSKWNPNE